MIIPANKQKLLFVTLSYSIFWLSSVSGYLIGENFGLEQMFYNFGEPRDLYPVLFALVSVFTGLLFGFLGIVITFLTMHWLGRRLKVAVGKPTLWGFLLYLLTLLVLILNYNRTH